MDIKSTIDKIKNKTAEIFPLTELREKLEKAQSQHKQLIVKLGVDPTAPDLHLGHMVVLRKLRDFQEIGHKVVLLIGDFTARIGDPSERAKTRPPLLPEQIDANAKTYADQAFIVLDKTKTQIRYNSEWLGKLGFEDVIRLTSNFTVARVLERDDFAKRYSEQKTISLHEFLYPVMQAYDSVELKADIEIGGTDQRFNLLAGRQLQQQLGQQPQVCVTMPILVGTDGVTRMSKSVGNYIGITESPKEMFGKTMSIPDDLIVQWLELATEISEAEVKKIASGLESGKLHPGEQKRRLAKEIITIYYSSQAATAAEEEFDRIFKQAGLPDTIPEKNLNELLPMEELAGGKLWIVKLLVALDLAPSNREARKLVEAGSVSVNSEKIISSSDDVRLENGMLVQVGKRRFCRILI
jgi:tyrosyl-tRNA synthetase